MNTNQEIVNRINQSLKLGEAACKNLEVEQIIYDFMLYRLDNKKAMPSYMMAELEKAVSHLRKAYAIISTTADHLTDDLYK